MRLLGRVFFWFLAVCGALALGLLGVWASWLTIVQWDEPPDWRRFLAVSDNYEQAIRDELSEDGADIDCEAVVELVAKGVLLDLPGAWRGLEAADADGRCGRWPERRFSGERNAEFSERAIASSFGWNNALQRTGWLMQSTFRLDVDARRLAWMQFSADRSCESPAGWRGMYLDFRTTAAQRILGRRTDPSQWVDSFESLMESLHAEQHYCGEYIFNRWAPELMRTWSAITVAGDELRSSAWIRLVGTHHQDAYWLAWQGYPRVQRNWIEGPPDSTPEEQQTYALESLRHVAAFGNGEAAQTLISFGAEHRPVRHPDHQGEQVDYPWAGGYATPFWMAVHAQRFALPYVEQRRAAYEAEIGDECTALARRIGAMLPALFAQLPEDRPEVRDLILSSLACQPEGLREAAAYPGGGYWPPEIDRVAPDFTPSMIPEGWVWREGDD
ncbi:hypothetical protein FKB34_01090 [Glycocaulis profundi]|nr:hypothetical protein FKB34_01090 [Glycocaulis profundi]